MCMMRKAASFDYPEPETIKDAVKANASIQKANVENRIGKKSLISDNIRTSNVGLDDDVETSKKKLLGE